VNGFLVDTNVVSEATRPNPSRSVAAWLEETARETPFFSARWPLVRSSSVFRRLPSNQRRRAL